MPDKFIEMIPFVSLVAGKVSFNTAKIIEIVVAAGLIALIASVLMIPQLKVTLENLGNDVVTLSYRVDKIEISVEEIKRNSINHSANTGE